MTVGVHVDGSNTFSVDDDFPPPLRLLRQCGSHAADDAESSQHSKTLLQYLSTSSFHPRSPIPTHPSVSRGPAILRPCALRQSLSLADAGMASKVGRAAPGCA